MRHPPLCLHRVQKRVQLIVAFGRSASVKVAMGPTGSCVLSDFTETNLNRLKNRLSEDPVKIERFPFYLRPVTQGKLHQETVKEPPGPTDRPSVGHPIKGESKSGRTIPAQQSS